MYHGEDVYRFVLYQVDQPIGIFDYFTDFFCAVLGYHFSRERKCRNLLGSDWSTDQPPRLRNEESLELCERGFQRDPGSHCESIRHASFW
jgi:hypothetical protein